MSPLRSMTREWDTPVQDGRTGQLQSGELHKRDALVGQLQAGEQGSHSATVAQKGPPGLTMCHPASFPMPLEDVGKGNEDVAFSDESKNICHAIHWGRIRFRNRVMEIFTFSIMQ